MKCMSSQCQASVQERKVPGPMVVIRWLRSYQAADAWVDPAFPASVQHDKRAGLLTIVT